MRFHFLFSLLLIFTELVTAQRVYRPNSVLGSGNWYKVAISTEGVYKIDLPFLNALGVNTNNINSNTLRVFGYGGSGVSERNAATRPDDLPEVAIMVFDGGDGIFNGNDYLLFYSAGIVDWIYDPVNQQFTKKTNLFSNFAYYYINIGGIGRRISINPGQGQPNSSVDTYDSRQWIESDSINFLNSGKEWFGQEFAQGSGKSLFSNFNLSLPNPVLGTNFSITTSVVSRSSGVFSRFTTSVNNLPVIVQDVAFTGNGPYDPFVVANTQSSSFAINQANPEIRIQYAPGNAVAQGWLNYLSVSGRSRLIVADNDQLLFRDLRSVGQGNITRFNIQATSAAAVWDITDPLNPTAFQLTQAGSSLSFSNNASQLREYVAFTTASVKVPIASGMVLNQDLHNSQPVYMIIIANNALMPEAKRVADHHIQRDNLKVIVTSTEQIYNEFSSGVADPSALRDFVKMYYDKAGTNVSARPEYLLLFGDASFDYKSRINNNTNLVPTFQSANSIDPLATYCSDDFFGFLDDNEDINDASILNLLDIGIGRIPATTLSQAKAYVDKIIAYSSKESFGPWRNEITFIADDEDNNLHLNDAEFIASNAASANPLINQEKIYIDAYRQESGSGGERYPAVNAAINNKLLSGNLFWNYLGHGSYRRLAEEVVLDQDIVNSVNTADKLPVYITATCDFSPYDNPLQPSLGEFLILKPITGAIALVSSTRVVFANSNKNINDNFLTESLKTVPAGNYLTLGESIKEAKNFNYRNFPDVVNNRKFTLLGDPALTPAFPKHRVTTLEINGVPVSQADTLKSLGKYIFKAAITDLSGNVLNDFNGRASISIFDKATSVSTLANDPGSLPVNFSTQRNMVYKGKVIVENGRFTYSFIVPKDISVTVGKGRISYYAENGITDANGMANSINIGGISSTALTDTEGPDIKAFLNDEKFVNGTVSNSTPILILKLADSSGINATGAGIGHDITAVLDNDNSKIFELNAAYETDYDTYTRGSVRFQLPRLENGVHTLKIKAWDVYNNSSEYLLEFRVVNEAELDISNVLNYPNPFTSKTNFWFEHNHPGEDLFVDIQIFTVSGKLVKSLKQTINNIGNRSSDIVWDGKDDYGQKLGRGVYIYRLSVRSGTKFRSQLQKLVLL